MSNQTQVKEEEKTNEIMNRLIKLSLETEERTNAIAIQLAAQREKTGDVEKKTEELKKETGKTKKMAKQIASFWTFVKDGVKSKYSSIVGEEKKEQEQIRQESNTKGEGGNNGLEAKIEEDDDKLDEVLDRMHKITANSKKIGAELSEDIEQLNRIQKNIDDASRDMLDAQKNINKRIL